MSIHADHNNPLLAAALAYAEKGLPIFPCRPGGKEPLTSHGLKDATTDRGIITGWWRRWPAANIAIVTGAPSGLVAIDIDKKPDRGIDGEETLRALEVRHGPLPETGEQITGGGGSQRFFRHPGGTIPNSTAKLGPCVDVRGDGGYVIVPPSIHPNGKRYEWEVLHHPDDIPLADLPPAWVALLRSQSSNGTRPHIMESEPIREGQRNDALASLAGTMRRRGMSESAIAAALLAENQARCSPPLAEEEVKKIAHSIGCYPAGPGLNESSQEEPDEPEEPEERTTLPDFPEIAWRGVFQTYREAMEGTTEAPAVTHFAALWTAAAVRLRRRVWFPYGLTLFPNVYLVVHGPTGDRKTTGTRKALDLLPEGVPVKVLQGIGSGEGLGDWLSTDDTAPVSHLLFLEELSELLIRGRWDGATLLPFLTRVFDCPVKYELPFRKNPICLKDPTLSVLAGTTSALFWQHLREVDIHGGFANRPLYLTGPVKAPIALPAKPNFDKLAAVHQALARLDTLTPQEATLSPEARILWEQFYRAWCETELDPLVKAATERVPAYCLKLAIVYAALEETLPTITADQLKAAIAVGRYAVRCTERLIEQRTTTSRQGACEAAVTRALSEAARGLPAWRLHHRTGGRFTAEELNRALVALERVGTISPASQTSHGKPIYALPRSRSRNR